ncbi:hypothetical protein BOTBODRAFT_51999 [Botryobasidium botryosum FD-172 SS1]|uniref:F-box domain-containing protein n=1 Tax=Botryobasidium botryosum (strain FD-172 SS1) TaxID=930990 RepID=A0A067MY92_BOTB1|nr:hypothetical protein BOTBODRAFT_51999 [Botryobasidium botryosum FD-172 SS1]
MVSLTELDYETLSALLLNFSTCSSLFSLALTCRTLRNTIIPKFLYARPTLPDNERRIASFCNTILAQDAAAGDAVRHLAIPFGYASLPWGQALAKMPSLCSVDFDLEDVVEVNPSLPKSISAMTHLTSLSLGFLPGDDVLEFLRDLRPLQCLVANGSPSYHITSESPLGDLLLRSRDTLVELQLNSFTWNFDPRSASDCGDRSFIWPRIHTLLIGMAYANYSFSLPLAFPSTRHLVLPPSQEAAPDHPVLLSSISSFFPTSSLSKDRGDM